MNTKVLVTVGAGIFALCALAKTPVIMTIAGEDVPESEFEYLYTKNSQQQLSPITLDDYVGMFELYKQKVAAARAAGVDTTAKFKKEMAQYRRELAAPYLTDSAYLESFVIEAADRSAVDVEASHIMFGKTRDAAQNAVLRARLDSIRNLIVEGADFTAMADKYSQDRSVVRNHGNLGYIPANRYPYAFETAAYMTPSGRVSEVVESPVGYHLVKPGDRRPTKGRVLVSHILLMTRDKSPEEAALAKTRIDSIYRLAKANPASFADLARANSEDPGSASKGGELPWFGAGEMVPEFENTAFALADGEVSEPFQSSFGWHIILRKDHKGAYTADELRDDIMHKIANPQDPRSKMIKDHQTETLAAKHKGALNGGVLASMQQSAVNGVDSALLATWRADAADFIATIDGNKVPVSEFAQQLRIIPGISGDAAASMIDAMARDFYARKLVEAEENWLYDNVDSYRNLLNEYRDGSMLYEVSLERVWDKASKDTEGLDKYFEDNRDNYKWLMPRAKGLLVQAANDSIGSLIRQRMGANPADSVFRNVRKEFNGKAKFDRVLVEQGVNPMVDNLMFGGPQAKPQGSMYTVYFMIDGKVIEAPEDVADVRAQVTSDYQSMLEDAWARELQSLYPAKLNKKVFKKLKARLGE